MSTDHALNIPSWRPDSESRPPSARLRSREAAYANVAENCGVFIQVTAACPPLETEWKAGSSIDQSRANNDNNYRWNYSPEEFQWVLKIGVWRWSWRRGHRFGCLSDAAPHRRHTLYWMTHCLMMPGGNDARC
jgi:hypothetical protein